VALYVAQGGQTFSEAALVSETYHCDAIADVDSEIEIHPKQSLIQALDTDAKASRAFMAHLARQVIALRSRLEIRNIRSAEQRVLQFIRLQVDETDQQVVFQRPLKDIAADLGLTHEAVYRTLAKLEKSAKISRQGRIIRLLKCVE
jgi:CRP-like cAMP-binding protein